MKRRSRREDRVVLALVLSFVSGCSALIHQMVWIRRMVDTLGATADTFAAVTGAFFIGLAVGGWLSTRLRISGGSFYLAWIAYAELAVGGLALLVLFSPHLAPLLSSAPVPSGMVRLLVPVLLIAPPAVFMGLVTPWLIRACMDSEKPVAVPIYALNTVGGIFGILVCLLVLLPMVGTIYAGGVAVMLNLLVAGLAWLARGKSVPGRPKPADGPRWGIAPVDALIAFGSGFFVLAAEVILQLQLTQVTVNSLFSSGFVLILVLAGLSAGAFLSGVWLRIFGQRMHVALLGSLFIAGVGFAIQPLLFAVSFGGLKYQPYQIGAAPYFLQILGPGFLSIVLPFLLAGLTFPLLLRKLEVLRDSSVGLALACNGFGGWLGAEVAQGVFLPRLGLWGAVCFLGAGYAVLCAFSGTTWKRFVPAAAGVIFSAGAWMALSGLPQVRPTAEDQIRALGVGREGVVAVSRGAPDDWRILFNNSYTLGGSRAAANQERQAHLPVLLHGRAKSVATLGLATGSTASGAACHPGVERIDVIELSPLVMKYAAKYFGDYNRGLFSDNRVRAIHADARWEVLRHPGEYDVIIGDLFLPWRTGEGRLYSLEHFQAVRRALKPGGIFCQWLPMYQLTEKQFAAIARTFQAVFPGAFFIRGDFYADKPILGLVGGRAWNEIPWDDVRTACARLAERESVSDPIVRHAEGVAMMTVGPLPRLPDGPLITLDNGWIEWDAGRNIIGGGEAWFTGVPLARFIRESHRGAKSGFPQDLAHAHEAGQFFLTLSVAHAAKLRVDELEAQMPGFLPEPLAKDPQADWTRWPGYPKPFAPR